MESCEVSGSSSWRRLYRRQRGCNHHGDDHRNHRRDSVGEGPIFGHRSYQLIPPGDPFVLTYTFDEEKGKQTISGINGETDYPIGDRKHCPLFSGDQRDSADRQRGVGVWAVHPFASHAEDLRKQQERAVRFHTQSGGNRVSAQIVPGKGRLLAEERRLAGELHLQFARRQHRFLFGG